MQSESHYRHRSRQQGALRRQSEYQARGLGEGRGRGYMICMATGLVRTGNQNIRLEGLLRSLLAYFHVLPIPDVGSTTYFRFKLVFIL